ncbi:MAG: response regulator [Maribacter sp.]|nr:response regulator [Maribacter sp.]
MHTVLLIEDDSILRENTQELLELSNYKVITSSNGEKGIEAAKLHQPDIILCDIMMPELDGYAVLEALSHNSETQHIPFIFLSAKSEHKDIRKGMELGADDYLTKPFDENELIGAIESRLAKIAILKEAQIAFNANKGLNGMRTIDEMKNFIDENGKEYSYEVGENIYQEGMNANSVYLVLSGLVKTHKLDETGKELITGIYKPDDFFGFSSFAQQLPYSESASAIEVTKLVGIQKEKLNQLLEDNHELSMELMQVLTENLSEAKEQLLQMAYGTVRRKTASTLLKFAQALQKDPEGNLHVLRSDLANVAGMATETLIRTLSAFRKEGLIDIKDRNIKILDIDKLGHIY